MFQCFVIMDEYIEMQSLMMQNYKIFPIQANVLIVKLSVFKLL
jgi:hypothetical protein